MSTTRVTSSLHGRSDDTIIRGGENIAPAEVEDVLIQHPDIADVGVVGLPDDEWGQLIYAAVVPRPGANLEPEPLRAWARERLRGSRTPDRIVLRPSKLDRPTVNTLVGGYPSFAWVSDAAVSPYERTPRLRPADPRRRRGRRRTGRSRRRGQGPTRHARGAAVLPDVGAGGDGHAGDGATETRSTPQAALAKSSSSGARPTPSAVSDSSGERGRGRAAGGRSWIPRTRPCPTRGQRLCLAGPRGLSEGLGPFRLPGGRDT